MTPFRDQVIDDEGQSEMEVTESEVLCQFPEGMSPNFVVTMDDYKSLEAGTWVTDAMVDIYLCMMQIVMMSSEDLLKVKVFETAFYKQMLDTGINLYWTKNVDIFNKELLLVPSCSSTHWFLIVVVKPGAVASNGTSIVLLDR